MKGEKISMFKYMIFQLKDTEREKMFLPSSFLLKEKLIKSLDDITSDSYNKVYEAEIPEEWKDMPRTEMLETIFEKFNIAHPKDFHGHSLSVSDVVWFGDENINQSAYYVEDIGYTRLMNFYKKTVTMPVLLQRVIAFLEEARAKYPCEVDNDGRITYANGNDGTGFDWDVNNRLPEIGWGVPDGSVWAFKCYVYNDGQVEIYCYPNREPKPVDVLERKLFTENEAKELYWVMYNATDRCGIYDVTLEEIDWN